MARIKITAIKLAAAIAGHARWCVSMNYSDNTMQGYEVIGKLFLGFMGDVVLNEIGVDDIERFMKHMVETPVSPAGVAAAGKTTRKRRPKTLRNYQIYLASLWSWATEHQFANEHVIHRVKSIRVPEEPIEPLTNEEITRLVKSVDESRPWRSSPLTTNRRTTAARDRMIIHLLIDTMVRASEAINLRIEDVTFLKTGGELRVIEGKGKKNRTVPFAKRTAQAISHYLLTRPGSLPTDHLLVNEVGGGGGTPMSRDNLTKLIGRLAKKAGVGRVSAHRLRTTGACERVRNGITAFELARLMGHSNIATTQRYVRAANIDLHERALTTSPMDNLRL